MNNCILFMNNIKRIKEKQKNYFYHKNTQIKVEICYKKMFFNLY